MLFESWDQLDYVRDRFGPTIERELGAEGFVVLMWGDAGWVHKFARTPATSPKDYMALKMFVRSGDPNAEKLWRAAGFDVIALSSTDVLTALKTGMLDAVGTTPLFALSSQWFGITNHMTKINWSPLNGATVVSRKKWDKIPAGVQAKLLKIAREEGQAMIREVRAVNDKAIAAMVARGLVVHEPTPEVVRAWRDAAKKAYPAIRGQVVPKHHFDEVVRLAAEYREKRKP